MVRTLLLGGSLFALFGCSSVISVEAPTSAQTDGLIYYMPNKDILVTLTVKDKVVNKAAFAVTPAYPDLSRAYVLSFARNPVGKNTLDVTVSEQGLLTVANSTTVSGVSDAFKGLAAAAGTISGLAKNAAPNTAPPACIEGDNVFRYSAKPAEYNECGVKITIERLLKDPVRIPSGKTQGTEYSGVFYRQNQPYLISVETLVAPVFSTASIQFSPSESGAHFLPIGKTLFSNNAAAFAFTDGMPTKYKQDTDGELIALFKLPADVIAAYFTAIGTVFDSFKSNDDKKAAILNSDLQLQLAQKKYDACITAIKAKDDATVKQLGC